MGKAVTKRDTEEDTLREKIRQLKEREKKIREEAELRERVFKRFRELEQRIDSISQP